MNDSVLSTGRTSYANVRSMPPRSLLRQGAMPVAFGVPRSPLQEKAAADFGYPPWDRPQTPADIAADLALIAARSFPHGYDVARGPVARVGARRLERRTLRDAWWQTRFADLAERRRTT